MSILDRWYYVEVIKDKFASETSRQGYKFYVMFSFAI